MTTSMLDGRVVYLDNGVDGAMTSARKAIREMVMRTANSPILLVITSGGGSVRGGMALLDEMELLRDRTGVEFHGIVQGMAASMALTILQGCDRRLMGSFAVVMAHGISYESVGDITNHEAERELADILTQRMAQLYATRTKFSGGLDVQGWLELFRSRVPRWYTPEQALKAGLVDEIIRDGTLAGLAFEFDTPESDDTA